ncbi:MAG: 2-oxoacid:ferredoxin oxidoreductase subunit beta [Spirochaetes bacterium]|nr:MAG: 2-oxoacid:ferredoxin oxidoreductase subunit beta [Spirochaetota bacterium]
MMESVVHHHLRPKKKFPHIWCPGCGHGIILSALVRALEKTGRERDEVVLVSGIGCSSRAPTYVDFSSLHGTHGRALAFATGIKLGNPRLTVIVLTGDGDALAIGGNHFIHACRRNIDITTVVFNNNIYGMTGGQYSPTMPTGAFAATAPYGMIEQDFDVCNLSVATGASFVARGAVTNPVALERYIRQGILTKGFSVIDVVEPCPPIYGFYNKTGTALDMMRSIKERTISIKKAESLSPEELKGKVLTGVFIDREYREYTEEYNKVIEEAKRSIQDEEPL